MHSKSVFQAMNEAQVLDEEWDRVNGGAMWEVMSVEAAKVLCSKIYETEPSITAWLEGLPAGTQVQRRHGVWSLRSAD